MVKDGNIVEQGTHQELLDKKQFYRAKKIVYGIDPTAFMIVSEAQEVYGEGFLDSDWEV